MPLSSVADPNWVGLDELDKAREGLEERFGSLVPHRCQGKVLATPRKRSGPMHSKTWC